MHCQSICKKCEEDGSHVRYRQMVKRGFVRAKHAYPKGQYVAKLLRRDRDESEKLICISDVV